MFTVRAGFERRRPRATAQASGYFRSAAKSLDPREVRAQHRVAYAVFSGHAHTYERLFPLRDGKPADQEQDPHYVDPRGTLYVVSGCGAKVKSGAPTRQCGPTAFFKDETILWTRVHVQGASCTIESFASATDELVDTATITKHRLDVARPAAPPRPISADSAGAVAEAYLPRATLLSERLEREEGQLVYSCYLELARHSGIEEIDVDALSGAIFDVETPSRSASGSDSGATER